MKINSETHPGHDYCRARGISDRAERRRKLRTLEKEEAKKKYGWAARALEIPFYDSLGKPLLVQGEPYTRARLFWPQSFGGSKDDRPKFVSPKDKGNHLYLDPARKDWAALFADPTQLLVITEGEFKAISAHEHGLPPTIALSGVDSWRTKKTAKGPSVPLPEFDQIAWQGRPVWLVFDSDIVTKRGVRRALEGLAEHLTARGAVVEQVLLPANKGEKVGLDDWCVAQGKSAAEAFAKLERGPLAGSDKQPRTQATVAAIDGARVDGAKLLTEVRAFIRRFCVFSDEHSLNAVALWAAHAHMVLHFHTTPRLALVSAELGSGKTRVLEILNLLVPDPMMSLSASPATVFRRLAGCQITLLFDEIDTIFKSRGKDDSNEDLRALLNAGYKQGATVPRCVGPRHDVIDFPVFCATALAGIGDLPDTIMSRSIIIRMRRRSPTEPVEPFRSREHDASGHALREQLAAWGKYIGPVAGASWPKLPKGVVDRPAEVWEPLLAVAEQAGGEWPELARAACEALCKVAAERKTSLGVRLLGDLRLIFGDAEALHTATILERLCGDEDVRKKYGLEDDAPWGDLYGKPLTDRGLANRLANYGVKPLQVNVGGTSKKGYRRDALWDAWQRYLPPSTPAEAKLGKPGKPPKVSEVSEISPNAGGAGGTRVKNVRALLKGNGVILSNHEQRNLKALRKLPVERLDDIVWFLTDDQRTSTTAEEALERASSALKEHNVAPLRSKGRK